MGKKEISTTLFHSFLFQKQILKIRKMKVVLVALVLTVLVSYTMVSGRDFRADSDHLDETLSMEARDDGPGAAYCTRCEGGKRCPVTQNCRYSSIIGGMCCTN